MLDPRDPAPQETRRGGLLEATRTYWWAIALTTILCGALGYGSSFLVAPEYRARTTLYLKDPSTEGVFGEAPPLGWRTTRVFTEARQASSDETLDVAAARLAGEYGEVRDLSRRVSTEPVGDLDAIRITATGPTSARAAAYAEAVSAAYRDQAARERLEQAQVTVRQLQEYQASLRARLTDTDAALDRVGGDTVRARALQAERDALQRELLAAQRAADQLLIDAQIAGNTVYRVEPPQEPAAPYRPQREMLAGIAGLIGLIGSFALVVWYVERAGPVRDPAEPGGILRGRLLARLPDRELRPEMRRSAEGLHASWGDDVTRALRFTGLSLLQESGAHAEGGRVITATGTTAGDRSAETVLGVGLVLAQNDRRVALVDADLSARRLRQLVVGDRSRAFVASVASGAHPPADAARRPSDPSPSEADEVEIGNGFPLRLFAVGPDGGDPFAYLTSGSWAGVIEGLRDLFDLVLVYADSPVDTPEAAALARVADAVLLVVPTGTSVARLGDVSHSVDALSAPLVGYVFDDRPADARRSGGRTLRRRGSPRSQAAVSPDKGRMSGVRS